MLKKGIGRNSLNVYLSFDGFLWRIFSIAGIKGAQLEVSAIFVQSSISLLHPEFGIRSRVLSRRPHLQNWFSLPLFPLTEEGATSALGFWPIILPLSSSFPGQAILQDYYLFHPVTVQTSVGFHFDLDLLLQLRGIDLDSYSSLNGHSLGGLLIQTRRGRGHSFFLSSQW